MAAAGHRHRRQCTQGQPAVAEVQAGRHPEAIPAEATAEAHPAATDRQDRIGHLQAATTHPVLHQGAPAVTLRAEVPQVHILQAVQAVATQAAGSPAADHQEVQVDRTAAEAPEAEAEEGNH